MGAPGGLLTADGNGSKTPIVRAPKHAYVHVTCGVGRSLHSISASQYLVEVLQGYRRVRVAAESEHLPKQHSIRPPAQRHHDFQVKWTRMELCRKTAVDSASKRAKVARSG